MNLRTWTKRLVLLVTLIGLGLTLSGCSMLGKKQTTTTYNDYRPPSSSDYYGTVRYDSGTRW